MQLYNSLSHKLETVKPISDSEVRIYSCGPTVYDYLHIGNLRSFIVADTLRRALKAAGLNVHHVMNLTDVDDKTIRRSQEVYPDLSPKAALRKLTSHYSELFFQDLAAVGNEIAAYDFVKATGFIDHMQALIKALVEEGYAYTAEDGIYFSIAKYQAAGFTYGQLTTINQPEESEARIANDEYDKADAHDFALWKRQKGTEPAWEFKLDGASYAGRPGWHIECSAMSVAQLGQPFDIHTGGIDLLFPHHENEIAQSTARPDHLAYAKLFVHNEHLLVDGQKMSKSLHNSYTLSDITDRGIDPLAFRLLILQAHYRSQAHFNWEVLQAAQQRLQRYRRFAVLRYQLPSGREEHFQAKQLLTQNYRILPALWEDLNTPAALSELERLLDDCEAGHIKLSADHLEQILTLLDQLFGLQLLATPDIGERQRELMSQRQAARQSKDWQKADSLRQALQQAGVSVEDSAEGTIWYWQ